MKKIVKKIVGVILVLGVCGGAFYFIKRDKIDDEKILAQSILKNKTFENEVVEVVTDDGTLKAYLMEEHSLPIVAIDFGFDKAGSAYETKEGLGLFINSILLDGTKKHNRKDFRDELKEKGIKISVDMGRDRLAFSFSYIKKFEKEAVALLKEVLYEPALNKEDFELTRRQLAVARRQQLENPNYYLQKIIKEQFYKEHPYGRESIPDDEKLTQITENDVRNFLAKAMVKSRLSVGVAGDINVDEAKKLIGDIFSLLNEDSDLEMAEFVPDFYGNDAKYNVDFSAQSFVNMYAKGIKRLDEDFYPLYIADYVFGGSGLNSRLNKIIREKEGLTYGVYSYMSNSDAVDLWGISFSATPEKAEQAIDLINKEYENFYENGVSKEEFDLAQNSLLDAFNLRFSSLFNIANMLEIMQVQKLGLDFLKTRQEKVKAVSLEAVNNAIKKKLPKTLKNEDGVRKFIIIGKNK